MNSVTRALPFSPALVRFFFVAAIACALLFSFSIPKAQAAGLTDAQIQAVLGVLISFNVDQATIANVNLALHGVAQAGSAASTQTGGSASEATFTVSPASGAAPLTVTFTLSHPSTDPGTFSLEFGDGQTIGQDGFSSSCSNTNCTLTVKHVYASAGAYTFKLFYQPPMPTCPAGLSCTQVMPAAQTISTATITVTSPTAFIPATNPTITPTVTPAVTPTVIPIVIPAVTPAAPSGNQSATTTTVTPTVPPTTGSGTTSVVTPAFSASPTSGTAPLNIVFTTNVSGSTVVFGDGTSAPVTANCLTGLNGSRNCDTGSYLTTHTYTTPGTYTATLRGTQCPSTPGLSCAQVITTLGTATITVTAPPSAVSPTFSAWPTSGAAPLTTYLTLSGVSSPSSYSVSFGDGSSGSNWQADTEAANTYYLTHTYATAGTYTATLNRTTQNSCSSTSGLSCAAWVSSTEILGTATITVTGNTSTGNAVQPALTASPTSVASGQSVKYSFTYPQNTNYAIFSISCNIAVNTGSPDKCGTQINVLSNADYTLTFYNTSSSAQQVTSSYCIATSDGQYHPCVSGPTITVAAPVAQNFDAAGMMAAAVAAPFNILVDSLTELFVYAGIGQ